MTLEIRILGPLEVVHDGRALPLGGSKQRALLALLALHANQTLSADRLIDELWGARPPASAANALQVHIFRLRKALAADVIHTRPHGYELELEPDALDANRFERLVDAGAFDEALALWRGPALADLAHEPFVRAHADRLEDLRLTAREGRMDALLAGGRHDQVIRELELLIAAQPYRERLRGQLMVALYRAGRQADALDAFQEARRTLVDDLGIEPGDQLRALQRAILEQAPELSPRPAQPGPETLPRALQFASKAPFAGRENELRRLGDHWAQVARGDCACVFVAGEAGIGKTRLAARFATSLDGASVLYGRCDEQLRVPYQPFAEALGELPQTDRRAQFAAVTDALAARGRPVLLILDDLQWADPATLLLLRHLVSRARPRALILALHRENALLQEWADLRRDGADRLALRGLDETAVAALAGDPRLAARLHAETGGNPFFVRELLAHIDETGELGAPDTLRDVIRARVGRLGGPAQAALATAAVCGDAFTVAVVESVDGRHDILDALDEATAAGLISERGHGDYAFTHGLVRHALYEDLASARRARLHRRIGEALEASGTGSAQALAHHFAAAAQDGQTDKAARYAIAAGRDAAARGGAEQAAVHYRRGLEVLEAAGQAGGRDHRELRRLLRKTRYEPLPELGGIPWWLWGRLSRSGQAAVALAALVLAAAALAGVPALVRSHQQRTQASERARAQQRAALLAGIPAAQRPHRAGGAPAGTDPAARARLVADAAADIRTDAQRRFATVLRVDCEPYPIGGAGTYECLAVNADVPATERSAAGSAGQPYRLRIDFVSGRYAYCRVSPRAVKALREEVALSPACAGDDRQENVQGQPG